MSECAEYRKGYNSGYKSGMRKKLTPQDLLELDNYWKEKAEVWLNIAMHNAPQPPISEDI